MLLYDIYIRKRLNVLIHS